MEARKIYEEALSLRESLRKAQPGSVTAARDVTNLQQRQGALLVQMKEFRESLATSFAAQAILASIWKADPANFEIRRDMGIIQSYIADAHDGLKDYPPAENAYRKAVDIYQELQRRNLKSDRSQDDSAGGRSALGRWLARHGKEREAQEQLVTARTAFGDLMKRNPDAGFYERKLVRVIAALADLHGKQGQRVSACVDYRDANGQPSSSRWPVESRGPERT